MIKCILKILFTERMAGGSPAYYVVIKKDKKVKAFYWMVNSKNSYSLLQTVCSNNGINMTADKAPSVEITPEINNYLETAVSAYRSEIPDLAQPLRAVEMVDIIRELTDRDLVRRDTLGASMKKLMDEYAPEIPKRSERNKEKNKRVSEKWVVAGGSSQGKIVGDTEMEDDFPVGSTQVMDKLKHIFETEPRNQPEGQSEEDTSGRKENESEDEDDQEMGERNVSMEEGQRASAKRVKLTQEDHILDEERIQKIIKGVNKGSEQGIHEIQLTGRNIETTVNKSYELAKGSTKELKKAMANCFHEIQQVSKQSGVNDHNVKELIKAQKETNALLTALATRLDGLEKDKVRDTEQGPKGQLQRYCPFCRESTHDLSDCNDKKVCFRCGDINHKEGFCFWKERSCNRCHGRGHKRSMHETVDPEARAALIIRHPKEFSHFYVGTESTGAQDRGRGNEGGHGSRRR